MKAFPDPNRVEDPSRENDRGMDLRDYFASNASDSDIRPYVKEVREEINEGNSFADWIDENTNPEIKCYARYRFADDMIEARNK